MDSRMSFLTLNQELELRRQNRKRLEQIERYWALFTVGELLAVLAIRKIPTKEYLTFALCTLVLNCMAWIYTSRRIVKQCKRNKPHG